MARLASNLECRIVFHGRTDTLSLINQFIQNQHPNTRTEFVPMGHWNELPTLAGNINEDHMFVIVAARKGTISYKTALEHLPEEITKYFSGKNLMIIFPDQFGEPMGTMTFAEPRHQEEQSAYMVISEWIRKKLRYDRNQRNN